jgi:hypothetical protein
MRGSLPSRIKFAIGSTRPQGGARSISQHPVEDNDDSNCL